MNDKTIKELTYHIGNVGVELKEANENRQDIDIAAYTYSDAKYIRKEIQVKVISLNPSIKKEDASNMYELISETIKE